MIEHYHKWYSQYINREFEMLVFGSTGIPVIFFPPAKERYYSAKDNGLVASLEDFINAGRIKLYTPDSYDDESWYNFSAEPSLRVHEYQNYESLIIHDIIGFVKYETRNKPVITAGFDFGGYHALNFTLKHPDLVSAMISIDGFFDIKQFIYGYYDDNCYFNNPPDYLPGLMDEWYLKNFNSLDFSFFCTNNEVIKGENQLISSLLNSKNIINEFQINNISTGWDSWNTLLESRLNAVIANL